MALANQKLLLTFAFLSAVLTSARTLACGNPPPPPAAIAINEPVIVLFDEAVLSFHVPDFGDPIIVRIRTSSDVGRAHQILGMNINFGAESVNISGQMLADIRTPVIDSILATAIRIDSKKVAVTIYVLDNPSNCAERHPKCGNVEFDWIVGGAISKLDQRRP